ncbi:hypothetical protein T439DRAFT_323479 [Meredithblackwellia eburnea MCA 4105]
MPKSPPSPTLPSHHPVTSPRSQGSNKRRFTLSKHGDSPPVRRLAFDLAGDGVQPQKEGFWSQFWRRLSRASAGSPSDGLAGGTSEGSASVAHFLQTQAGQASLMAETEDDEWQVDQVVVDREDRDENPRRRDGQGTATGGSRTGGSRTAGSQTDGTPEVGYEDDPEELRRKKHWAVRWAIAAQRFFVPSFDDANAEVEFRKLRWYSEKKLLFFAVVYLYINWILYLILNHSATLYEKIVYYGPLSAFTFPLPFLIYFNIPERCPNCFNILLSLATWYCCVTEIIQTKECKFFSPDKVACAGKDFLALIYYGTGFPALVLFAHGSRLYHAIGATVCTVLIGSLIIPVQGIFSRNLVSFMLFNIFIQAFHWTREKTERRMFSLNSQLKVAYRAQQKAQIAESSANQAKRRFASYLFHEVRVPLNTAMLAFQNLHSEGAFQDLEKGPQSLEIFALDSSLTTMQQVLNDVLDLQRMDAGKFEMTPRPFNLHKALTAMINSTRVATDAKAIKLNYHFDPAIDDLQLDTGGDGVYVVGDPIRLQQIVTNITSNATKFTPPERSIDVSVKLVPTVPLSSLMSPAVPSTPFKPGGSPGSEKVMSEKGDSTVAGHTDTTAVEGSANDFVTFRVEVADSGPGIRPSDLAGSRLFRPFAQTRVGRASGEGSGLGLAIVRQIISLSDGRLGIRSRKGEGAIFWFELTYRLASPAETAEAKAVTAPLSTPVRGAAPMTTNPRVGVGYVPLLTPLPAPLESPPSFTIPITPTSLDSPPSPSTSEITEEPLHCLVVDDDPLTRVLFTRMLTRLGATVETATNGKECVDLILGVPSETAPFERPAPRHVDLICLDNSMPVMNGEEAVRMLRMEGQTDLYVVGCTGNALTEDQQAYLRAGADRIIPKPVLLRDVAEILATAAERRAKRRAKLLPA